MAIRWKVVASAILLSFLLGMTPAEVEHDAKTGAVPPWLEPLRNRDGRVSWRAIAIGMRMREIAALLRVQLRTDLVMEAGCGGDALELVVDGVQVLMGFEGHTRNSRLHTLFVYAEPSLEANAAVARLKNRLPGARPAGLDDPRPAYRVGEPEVLLVIDPRGLWMSHPVCLE